MGVSSAAQQGGRIRRFTSSVFPSVGGALVTIAAIIIILAAMYAAYLAWRPSPLQSVEVIRVEPANRIIDRSRDDHLVVYRRVCATENMSAVLERTWIDETGGVQPTLVDRVWINKGCHERPPVHVYPPTNLSEGLHRYRVKLRWCNPFCHEYYVDDIEVSIVGRRPVNSRHPQADRF
jgi:hypothetical protein